MRLDRVILERFLTYEHLDYLIPRKPLQVQGKNLTEEDQESNGSGKSGIFTGIEFCIAASNSRDVRDAELVMFGFDDARAQLFASCDVRKESLHIDWTIKVKGSNKLTLKKKSYNGEWEEVSFSNVNDGKKYVLAWFDISKEDLFNYYIINKTRFKSFFKTSNKEKVDLINRFSDASIVDGIEKIDNTELDEQYQDKLDEVSKIEGKIEITEANILKENNRDFEQELLTEESDIKEEIKDIEGKIEEMEKSIEDEKEAISDYKEEKEEIDEAIESLKLQKPPIEQDIKSEEEFLKTIESELDDAKKLVEEFVSTDWDSKRREEEEKIEEKEEELESIEEEQDKEKEQETKILTFLQSIEVKLKNSITCPKCEHEFVIGGDIEKLREKEAKGKNLKKALEKKKQQTSSSHQAIKTSIKKIEEALSSINNDESLENKEKNILSEAVNSIKSRYNTKQEEIAGLKKKLDGIDTGISTYENELKDIDLSIKEVNGDISSMKADIKNHKAEIKNYEKEIKNLKAGNNEQLLKELEEDLENLKADKIRVEAEAQSIGDKIYERNQWINNFKQFRMFLANQSLEAIEFHCNRYLAGMGSDLKIKLEGFRMLASGAIKDEITAKVIRNVERTFSSFSGGEQGRLLFAAILANRHMINSTHKYGGLDFLSVDEVFEGVDSLGLKSLIKAAKQLEVAVMIITHVTDEEVSEDTLLIEKVNGISKIKQ